MQTTQGSVLSYPNVALEMSQVTVPAELSCQPADLCCCLGLRFLFFVYGCLHMHACLCTMFVPGTCGCQERALDALELEQQIVVSCFLSAGNWTWVLWEVSVLKKAFSN